MHADDAFFAGGTLPSVDDAHLHPAAPSPSAQPAWFDPTASLPPASADDDGRSPSPSSYVPHLSASGYPTIHPDGSSVFASRQLAAAASFGAPPHAPELHSYGPSDSFTSGATLSSAAGGARYSTADQQVVGAASWLGGLPGEQQEQREDSRRSSHEVGSPRSEGESGTSDDDEGAAIEDDLQDIGSSGPVYDRQAGGRPTTSPPRTTTSTSSPTRRRRPSAAAAAADPASPGPFTTAACLVPSTSPPPSSTDLPTAFAPRPPVARRPSSPKAEGKQAGRKAGCSGSGDAPGPTGGKASLKLSRADKVAIIHEHDAKPSLTQQETATKWSVDRSTISKILHSRTRWLSPPSPPKPPPPSHPRNLTLRPEGGRYKLVEERVNVWLDGRYRLGLGVEDGGVREMAREVWRGLQREAGEEEGVENGGKGFKGSAKWLGSFKDRRRLAGRLMAPLRPPALTSPASKPTGSQQQPPPSGRSAHAVSGSPSGSVPHGLYVGPPPALHHPYAAQHHQYHQQQQQQRQPPTLTHRLSSLSIPSSSAHSTGTGPSPSPAASYSPLSANSGAPSSSAAPGAPPGELSASSSDPPSTGGQGESSLMSPFTTTVGAFPSTADQLPGRQPPAQYQPFQPQQAYAAPRRPSAMSRHTTYHGPPMDAHGSSSTAPPGLVDGGGRPSLGQRAYSTNSAYPHYRPSLPASSAAAASSDASGGGGQARRRLGSGFEPVRSVSSGHEPPAHWDALGGPVPPPFEIVGGASTIDPRSRNSSRTESWASSGPAVSLFDSEAEERRRSSSVTSYGSNIGPFAGQPHHHQHHHPLHHRPSQQHFQLEKVDEGLQHQQQQPDTPWYYTQAQQPPAHEYSTDMYPPGPGGLPVHHSQPPSPRQQAYDGFGQSQHQPAPYPFFRQSSAGAWSASAQPSPVDSPYLSSAADSPGPAALQEGWHLAGPALHPAPGGGSGNGSGGWDQPMSVDPHEFAALKLHTPAPAPPPLSSTDASTLEGWDPPRGWQGETVGELDGGGPGRARQRSEDDPWMPTDGRSYPSDIEDGAVDPYGAYEPHDGGGFEAAYPHTYAYHPHPPQPPAADAHVHHAPPSGQSVYVPYDHTSSSSSSGQPFTHSPQHQAQPAQSFYPHQQQQQMHPAYPLPQHESRSSSSLLPRLNPSFPV